MNTRYLPKKPQTRVTIAIGDWGVSQQYFQENPYSFLLAYFHDRTPYLYVVNCMPGYAAIQKRFCVIGCGANVGGFILSRALNPKMGHVEALMAERI